MARKRQPSRQRSRAGTRRKAGTRLSPKRVRALSPQPTRTRTRRAGKRATTRRLTRKRAPTAFGTALRSISATTKRVPKFVIDFSQRRAFEGLRRQGVSAAEARRILRNPPKRAIQKRRKR